MVWHLRHLSLGILIPLSTPTVEDGKTRSLIYFNITSIGQEIYSNEEEKHYPIVPSSKVLEQNLSKLHRNKPFSGP